ncbi:Mini-ribonuclease 3 [Phocicoccus pinnipedialis]|uniref:Mini-ribonuclease 3 n=1 Tax=Phocicoccus pinnipedialis TaxID=110845 RepID=A0A6V7R4M9_9BACL|nr:ribonuclease III domain-containing protein [Jeotgalicoccus pinnipedialis]MBP1940067.1 ribonuclease-3 family protein [Jeotgalicoccus pinnipedialis]CAD2071985.1 Mini-ribonuclease 3 [Jeotgalicoccus pinnipedialis]
MGNIDVHDLTKAYLGDAVYGTYIRRNIIEETPTIRADVAHREANALVSAKGQSHALLTLREAGFITEEEWDIARKARNKSSATRAKNASIKEYRNATGMEALIGELYLSGKHERIEEIMKEIYKLG